MCALGVPFPRNYIASVKKIMTRLFRVFVHVYIHHFDKLVAIGAVRLTSVFRFVLGNIVKSNINIYFCGFSCLILAFVFKYQNLLCLTKRDLFFFVC